MELMEHEKNNFAENFVEPSK